jgi:hypothetical protein
LIHRERTAAGFRKCPACGVEYFGSAENHCCERDAWARPVAQPANHPQLPDPNEGAYYDMAKNNDA